MSARPLSIAGQRPSLVTMTNSIFSGLPRSEVAASLAMSTSNPTRSPFSSLKAKGGTVPSVTTRSLPRSSTSSSFDFSCAAAGWAPKAMAAPITATQANPMRVSLLMTGPLQHVVYGSGAPEQQRADALRLAQHRAELRHGIVHPLRVARRTAELRQRLRRHELDEEVGPTGRHTDEMHHQHVVVLEQQHRERRLRLVGDDRRRSADLAPLHRDLEDVVGADLDGRRRLAHPVADERPQLIADPFRRLD